MTPSVMSDLQRMSNGEVEDLVNPTWDVLREKGRNVVEVLKIDYREILIQFGKAEVQSERWRQLGALAHQTAHYINFIEGTIMLSELDEEKGIQRDTRKMITYLNEARRWTLALNFHR